MKRIVANAQLTSLALAVGSLWVLAQPALPHEPIQPIVIDSSPGRLRGIRPQLMSTTFSRDGKLLVTTAGWPYIDAQEPGELIVWDLASQSQKLIIRQEKTIRSAAFSSDGKLLAMSDFDGRALILDPTTGQTIVALPQHTTLVNMVRFSSDDKLLLACDFDGSVTIWDVAERKVIDTLTTPDKRLVTIDLTRDGKYLAACSQEGHSFVWNLPQREIVHSMLTSPVAPKNPRDTETIAFAPDGKSFVTGSYDGSVILWDTSEGQPLRVFDHAAMVCKVIFSPDGRRLFTSDHDGNVMLWNPETAERLALETPHNGPCYAMSISPDGKLLATGGFDRTVKLLDSATLQTIRVLGEAK
jgi:WD40 repeat protein